MRLLFRGLILGTTIRGSIGWRHAGGCKWRHRLLQSSGTSGDVSLKEAPDTLKTVVVRCPRSNRHVECFWDWSLGVGGVTGDKDRKVYFVLHPINDAVAICRLDESGELEPLDPDATDMDAVFPVAAALFAEEGGLRLQRTPTVLTLQGDIYADGDDDHTDDEDGAGDDDGDTEKNGFYLDEAHGGDPDDDVVELLAEFEIEDDAYALVRLLEPVCLIAQPIDDIGVQSNDTPPTECVLLSDEEGESVAPTLEGAILALGIKSRLL